MARGLTQFQLQFRGYIMAAIIKGDLNYTRFVQSTGVYGGGNKYAFVTRFKVNTANPTGSITIFAPNSTSRGEHSISGGELKVRLLTQDSDIEVTALSNVQANVEYTLFSIYDGASIKHFLDGVEFSSLSASANISATEAPAVLRGSEVSGEDLELIEAAAWNLDLPTELEIANYPQTAITDFGNQPIMRFYPSGANVDVTTIPELIVPSDLEKARGTYGATLTPQESSGSGADLTVTEINGTPVDESSTVVLGYNRQRVATFSVAGTYTDTAPSNIQMKIGANSYVNGENFTASGGNFSCDVTLPAGVGLVYRSQGGAAETAISDFIVGRKFIIDGQSNAEGTISSPPASFVEGAFLVEVDGETSAITINPAPSGDYHLAHGLALLSRFNGEPIIFINVAIGGTGIATHLRGGSSYATAMSELTSAGFIGDGAWKTGIWLQGENDTGVGTNEDYEANLKQLYQEVFVEDYGVDELYAIPIRHTGAIKNVQEGTIAAINSTRGIKLGCDIQDIVLGLDGLHINSPDEGEIIGARLSQTLIVGESPQGEFKNVTLTVSGIPDGEYWLSLSDGSTGHPKYDGTVTFSGESCSVYIECSSGDTLKGYVDDMSGTSPNGTRVLVEVA